MPSINVEKHKVLQVLVNLIRNGMHACDESGRAEKRLAVKVANGGDKVRISVRDNGVGLPEGFDLDKTRSLGLAIVRDLVRTQLAGTITMTSDHGAVARVQIPVRGLDTRREAPHLEV